MTERLHNLGSNLGYEIPNMLGQPFVVVARSQMGDAFVNIIIGGRVVICRLGDVVNALALVRKDQLAGLGITIVTPQIDAGVVI